MKKVVAGAAMGAFVIGAAVGALGSSWYLRNQLGMQLLTYVREDSAQHIKSYEKVKELVGAGNHQKAIELLNGQIEMARLSVQAAEEAERR